MRKISSFIILLFFTIIKLCAQNACEQEKHLTIRIFGDSWAHFPHLYEAYDKALSAYGYPDLYSTGHRTAMISMNSEAFLHPIARAAWEPMIKKDSADKVPFMMLSLLGNDIAFSIDKGDPLTVLDEPLRKAKTNMDTILDYIHEKCPEMKILWMCYDYPNFVDPLIDFPWNPYYDLWESAGKPSPTDVNPFIKYMAHLQDSILSIWNRPYMYFINNVGLMQYVYGQNTPLRVAPYGTYPPKSVPLPGGNELYPSPHEAMGLGGIDTYHLNQDGYFHLASYQMKKFFMEHIKGDRDTMIYSEGNELDGWVSSTGTKGTAKIIAGKNKNNLVTKGIITFNTSFIEDDRVIRKASLFLKRNGGTYSLEAGNIFPQNFNLEIINGTFGTLAIEASDFYTNSTQENIACIAGKPWMNNYTIRFDIDSIALQHINKFGYTQFRISIIDSIQNKDNILHFFTGDTTEFEGPYLDIYYDSIRVVSSIKTTTATKFDIYPNPTLQTINISNIPKEFNSNLILSIFDLNGKELFSRNTIKENNINIDVSQFSKGNYILKIEDTEHTSSIQFTRL